MQQMTLLLLQITFTPVFQTLLYSGEKGGDRVRLGFGRKKKNLPAEEGPAAGAPVDTTPPRPRLVVSAVSMLGGRKTQQDALDYRLLPNGAFAAAVCDGMGGLNGGAEASRTACDGFLRACEQALPGDARDLERIARRLDGQVAALKGADGQPLDGGTTIVAAVVKDDRLGWLSVGDSRIGLVRDGELTWLNRLHNYRLELDEALQAGELSPEEYSAELPRGRALLSYLGCGGLRYVDVQADLSWTVGDRLILCSDGFYELMSQPELLDLLMGLENGSTDLTRAVLPYLEAKGKTADNASAVVIQYQ